MRNLDLHEEGRLFSRIAAASLIQLRCDRDSIHGGRVYLFSAELDQLSWMVMCRLYYICCCMLGASSI